MTWGKSWLFGQEMVGPGTLAREFTASDQSMERWRASERAQAGEGMAIAQQEEWFQQDRAVAAADADAERAARLRALQADQDAAARGRRVGVTADAFNRQAAVEARRPDLWASDEDKMKYSSLVSRIAMESGRDMREAEATSALERARAEQAFRQRELGKATSARTSAEQALEQAAASGPISARERAGFDRQIAGARQDESSRMEELIQANDKRLAQEENIARVRIQSADESIARTHEEISLRQQLIDREKQRLMSAKERIAAMTGSEQRQYGEVLQKARRGEELSREEFNLIGSVNLEETERLRRQYAERRSQAFFEEYDVGREETERVGRLEQERQKLEVELKDKRELRLTVERNDSETVRTIVSEFNRITAERDKRLKEEILAEIERSNRQGLEKSRQLANQKNQTLR